MSENSKNVSTILKKTIVPYMYVRQRYVCSWSFHLFQNKLTVNQNKLTIYKKERYETGQNDLKPEGHN